MRGADGDIGGRRLGGRGMAAPRRETSGQAESILERVASGDVDLAVPELWLYELTNLLVSARRRGRISGEHVDAAQRLIDAVPYETFGLDSALVRQRAGAARRAYGLAAYHACYLELADRLQCPLATFDDRLATAAAALGLEEPTSRRS